MDVERVKLQAEQDTLAVQRQATNAIEHHLDKIRGLQEETTALRDDLAASKAHASEEIATLRDKLGSLAQKESALQVELQEQLTQLSQLQSHCELLSGTAAPKPRQRNDAEPSELDENGGAVVAADATAPETLSSAPADAPTADESPPAAIPDELPGLARELHAYEHVVNGALQANRALHEAYWRLRSLSEEAARKGQPALVPSHDELQLEALIEPGTGRRQLPSEAEKILRREKEALQQQLERAERHFEEEQRQWTEAMIDHHRGSVGDAADEELRQARQLLKDASRGANPSSVSCQSSSRAKRPTRAPRSLTICDDRTTS